MLTTNPLMAFLATANAEAATMFYRDRLGLRLLEETEFALEFECGEAELTPLRIQKLASVAPAPQTVLGWKVGNLAEEIDALLKRGVVFERYEGMEQDERGIWQAPSGALLAWFKDPDGNTLSLTQISPRAAAQASASPLT